MTEATAAPSNDATTRTVSAGSTLPHHHHLASDPPSAPFGTLLGVTHGGVEVFSCDYENMPPEKENESFENRWEGQMTGFKYQCVELARRYLLINHGVIFDSIPMAYDIFKLKSVRKVSDNSLIRMDAHSNGSRVRPQVGSLLIWVAKGFFKGTGHVAVITDVQDDYVDIVEQNVHDSVWPPGQDYSRRLAARAGPDGSFTLQCTYADTEVLGWMNVHHGEAYTWGDVPNCYQNQLQLCRVKLPAPEDAVPEWLDLSLEYNRALLDAGKVPKQVCNRRDPTAEDFAGEPYFTVTESGVEGLRRATDALHEMFMDASDYVFTHAEVQGQFLIPQRLWPMVRRSWYAERKDIVAGRLDLALTQHGLKVYEYNADSASALLECGHVQDRWSRAAGLVEAGVGRDVGDNLFPQLVAAWKAREVVGMLHLMRDTEAEEAYHTLYMKAAAEAAGITCKVIVGLEGLSFNEEDRVQDAEGNVVSNVWKTWSWRTAINQVTDQDADRYLDTLIALNPFMTKRLGLTPSGKDTTRPAGTVPKLPDVLLDVRVRVFEPLWTVIPSSKAILPILCKIRPGHPYLLQSSFTLTPELEASGYARKPVDGRGGKGVELYNERGVQVVDRLQRRATEPGMDAMPSAVGTLSRLLSVASPEAMKRASSSTVDDVVHAVHLAEGIDGLDAIPEANHQAPPSDSSLAGPCPKAASSGCRGKPCLLIDQEPCNQRSPYVYQELCMLPFYDPYFVQVNTWAVDGHYAAAVMRNDQVAVMDLDSEVDALRIVPDAPGKPAEDWE